MASAPEPSAPALRGSAGFGLGAICLVVSLFVHAVFAPLPNFSSLFKRRPAAIPAVTRAAFSEIPVDLGNDLSEAESAPTPAKDVEPLAPAAAEPASDSLEKPRAPRPQRAPAQASTSATSAGTASRPAGPRVDVALRASSNSSHVLGHALVGDCSVSALIDISRVRTHPLAAQLNGLLVEWQALFAEPGFDALSDVDRLLVVGPELRESGRGLAVVQHHLGGTQVQAALARAAAHATASGQEHFYLPLSPELLLLAPDRGSLRAVKDFALGAVPEGNIGTVYVDNPSRALANLPLEIAPSVHWLRGLIQPTADNGIAIDLEAGDENNELAKRHARQLTRSVLTLETKGRARLVERALFEAHESVIVGRLELTSAQIGEWLGVLSDRVKAPPDPPPAPEPVTSADDDPEPAPAVTKPEATETHETLSTDAGASQPAASAKPVASAEPAAVAQRAAAATRTPIDAGN